MVINKVKGVFFSPAKHTQKIITHFLKSLPFETEKYDITSYKKRSLAVKFEENELAVFAYPVYGGRVPSIVINQLDRMFSSNTPAVVIAVYGNRAYEDALLEMKNELIKHNFNPVAAAAFIANHSIMNKVAVNRPDESDLEIIKQFAEKVTEKLSNNSSFQDLYVKGNFPYRKYNGIPLKPFGDRKCVKCGACVSNCPVNAIPADNPRKTDKNLCITCMGCAAVCPTKARHLNNLIHELSEIPFKMKHGKRKEPEIFL